MSHVIVRGDPIYVEELKNELDITFEDLATITAMPEAVLVSMGLNGEAFPEYLNDRLNGLRNGKQVVAPVLPDQDKTNKIYALLERNIPQGLRVTELIRQLKIQHCYVSVEEIKALKDHGTVRINHIKTSTGPYPYVTLSPSGCRLLGIIDEPLSEMIEEFAMPENMLSLETAQAVRALTEMINVNQQTAAQMSSLMLAVVHGDVEVDVAQARLRLIQDHHMEALQPAVRDLPSTQEATILLSPPSN